LEFTDIVLNLLDKMAAWFVENIFNYKTSADIVIILAAFAGSFLISFATRKFFTGYIITVRRKFRMFSNPIKLLVDHLTMIVFPLLLFIVDKISTLFKYHTYFIKTVAVLAFVLLIIDLISHLIQNKMLSKFISFTISSVVVLKTFEVYTPVEIFLDSIAIDVGEIRVSIYFLIKGFFIFGLLIWFAGVVSKGFSNKLRQSKELTPLLKVLFGKLFYIISYLVAILIGLSSLGVNLTAFAVLSGAIGVGIGFGLQKIFSNLISGFILLIDKSIKLGDIIQLDEEFGTVSHMGGRYVSVTAWDGKEYLIPNEDIVTGRVINWTHSNRNILINMQIGVSYNSDFHLVKELIIKAALANDRVLKTQTPGCYLENFGDSAVNFTLYCWISDPENGMMSVKSDIYFRIWELFKENNVEIPFPQRDVHIKN